MLSFDQGVELGKSLATIKSNTRRIEALEHEVVGIKTLVTRGMLLAALWAVGIAGNLSAQNLGETLAAFVKAWAK